ncbi:MAG: N-acetylmuramoyl-L-alanine amidase [Firmicutes bacterium]|nr:N-acetylmuramoyl-L-alanine amidase [Bacillota bacterium]
MEKIDGIMLHSTGSNNPYLKRYVQPDDGKLGKNKNGNHWNQKKPDGRSVCVHAFIGKLENGNIATYQTLPFNMVAWHCGGVGNKHYISVELCEDDLSNKQYFENIYTEAIKFAVDICRLYQINPRSGIICHAEGYQRGIATNHSDVLHWFSNFGKTMNDFRNDVKRSLEQKEEGTKMIYNYIDKNMPEYARPVIQKIVNKGFLKGNEKGELGLNDDLLRTLVILDRAGCFDK